MSPLLKVAYVSLPVDAARLDKNVLGLAAIRAAIHAQRTADRSGNAAEKRQSGNSRPFCAARATITSSIAVPAVTRCSSIFTSLKPRPNLITTPGTPPSRTMRFEPAPMATIRNFRRQVAQEIRKVVFILRHEKGLRRTADPEPGEFSQRLIGEQPTRATRAFSLSARERCRENS